jgi:hypothetical protein
MSKFVNFVYYNIIVYVLYSILDRIFTFFNLYSSPELGTDLLVMPTNSDMTYIIINVVISTLLGYYILRKLNEYRY